MLKFRILSFVSALAVLCVVAAPVAQTPADPTFEVASVKPNKSGPDGPSWFNPEPGGLLRLINGPISGMIASAYEVRPEQVVGPDWIRSARFDVLAKAPSDRLPLAIDGPNSFRPLMRALPAERFKLVVHRESRLVPAYALVLARPDGRLGPRIERSATDPAYCQSVQDAERARQSGSPKEIPPGLPCRGYRSGNSFVADAQSMSSLAGFLGTFQSRGLIDRDVVDRTGLTGLFNYTLDLDLSGNGASIFTVIQEQLGLKLEPTMAPSDFVVVDHVEQPTED